MSQYRERSLTETESDDLREMQDTALTMLPDLGWEPSPEAVIEAIGEALPSLRALDRQPAFEASIALGALWGEQICRMLRWEWVWLTEVEDEQYTHYAVVPPGRELFISALFVLSHYAIKAKPEDTSVLLFNMLVAGNVPTAAHGELRELS